MGVHMNEALKKYLQDRDRFEFDAASLEEHLRAMTEKVIPDIETQIREADRLAAELRYAPAADQRKSRHPR